MKQFKLKTTQNCKQPIISSKDFYEYDKKDVCYFIVDDTNYGTINYIIDDISYSEHIVYSEINQFIDNYKSLIDSNEQLKDIFNKILDNQKNGVNYYVHLDMNEDITDFKIIETNEASHKLIFEDYCYQYNVIYINPLT